MAEIEGEIMEHFLTVSEIKSLIHHIRGKAVMLDRDLAELYGVETRVLNQSVRRNLTRFPEDFMIQLTADEMEILISQNVISRFHGGLASHRWLSLNRV